MEKLKERLKDVGKKIIYVLAVVVSFFLGFVGSRIHNNGAGTTAVREEFSNARKSVEDAEREVATASAINGELEESNRELQNTVNDNRTILQQIRKRGTVKRD